MLEEEEKTTTSDCDVSLVLQNKSGGTCKRSLFFWLRALLFPAIPGALSERPLCVLNREDGPFPLSAEGIYIALAPPGFYLIQRDARVWCNSPYAGQLQLDAATEELNQTVAAEGTAFRAG